MLTDLAIASLKPTGKQYIEWDIPNFGVRVSQTGTKTFIVMLGRERKRKSIGRYPELSLKDARLKAKQLLVGYQPATTGVSFGDAIESFTASHLVSYKEKPRKEVLRLMHKHLEEIKRHSIVEITKSDIVKIIDPLAPAIGNHLFGVLRTFFNWCERRDIIELSPMRKLTKPHKEKSRERVLTDNELIAIWNAAGEHTFGTIVRLLMLTGQRRGDIIGRKTITETHVTFHDTKNGSDHTVPRHEHWIGIDQDLSFNAWSQSKARLDKRCGVADWTLHDLRRTWATNQAKLGTPPHIIEIGLNHKDPASMGGKIASIYNRHKYKAELKAAFDAYADWLQNLLLNGAKSQ